jgi:aspartate dehydrogenase
MEMVIGERFCQFGEFMNIGIIGCGAIGSTLAKAAEGLSDVENIYVFDKSHVCSRVMEEKFTKVYSILEFEELIEKSDFICEAASQEAVQLFANSVLKSGKSLLIMSVGALVDDELHNKLKTTAKENGSCLYIPTGALCGVDGIAAASVSEIHEVTLITRKPPSAFEEIPYLRDKGIKLKKIKTPKVLFEGSAREAVGLFPKNVNVAATVSLSGIGFDRTMVTIVADPTTSQNHHMIVAKGAFGTMRAEMNNLGICLPKRALVSLASFVSFASSSASSSVKVIPVSRKTIW